MNTYACIFHLSVSKLLMQLSQLLHNSRGQYDFDYFLWSIFGCHSSRSRSIVLRKYRCGEGKKSSSRKSCGCAMPLLPGQVSKVKQNVALFLLRKSWERGSKEKNGQGLVQVGKDLWSVSASSLDQGWVSLKVTSVVQGLARLSSEYQQRLHSLSSQLVPVCEDSHCEYLVSFIRNFHDAVCPVFIVHLQLNCHHLLYNQPQMTVSRCLKMAH